MSGMLDFEERYWDTGCRDVAGIDEAGRGPLAGPVVAAAVVMDAERARAALEGPLSRLTDSKQLSQRLRNEFFDLLRGGEACQIGIGSCSNEEIDQTNILKATHLAMARAVTALSMPVDIALVDGLAVHGLPCPSEAIVKGDTLSLSIAAASVVAKVTRDRMMEAYDREYPCYEFRANKGYGTSTHMQALLEHGPCPIHRRTFRPVREAEQILRFDFE